MRDLFKTIGTWGRKAFLALRTIEAAMEYRYEDYAQQRFDSLEKRIASLEEQAVPSGRRLQ